RYSSHAESPRRRSFSYPPLFHRVTGNACRAEGRKLRPLAPAAFARKRAARMKGAAGWRRDRVRDLPFRRFALPAALEVGDRLEQHPRVRVTRVAKEFGFRRDLADAAKIHDADPIRNMIDDRKVVADKKIGEAKLILQLRHQVEDLRLHGNIEGRGRLIANEKLGLTGEGAGDGR